MGDFSETQKFLVCFRLLRRELSGQKRDLENGRADSAVSRFKTIRPLIEKLSGKLLPHDPSGRIDRVMLQCSHLNDRVEELLQKEAREISREIFALKIEEQLNLMRENPNDSQNGESLKSE